MMFYDPQEVREYMQTHHLVLIASDFTFYGRNELPAVQEALIRGREVPEELRDDNFKKGLSQLEFLAARVYRGEINLDEPQRNPSSKVVVSDQQTKSE